MPWSHLFSQGSGRRQAGCVFDQRKNSKRGTRGMNVKISEDIWRSFCHFLGSHGMSWDVMGHLPTNVANQLFWENLPLNFNPAISPRRSVDAPSDEDAALTSRTSDRCQKNQQTDPNTKQDLALWTRKPILRIMFAYSRKHILKKTEKQWRWQLERRSVHGQMVCLFFSAINFTETVSSIPWLQRQNDNKNKALAWEPKRKPKPESLVAVRHKCKINVTCCDLDH